MKQSVSIRCPFSEKTAFPLFSERFADQVWCDCCGKYFCLSENEKVTSTKEDDESEVKTRRFVYPSHSVEIDLEKHGI